jgi:hypothetical protein
MLTGVAILVQGPGHDFAGAGAFVLAVLVIIAVIFIRVYGGGNQARGPTGHHSRRRAPHKSGRQAAHQARHPQHQGENHEHRPESGHRPHQH